MNKVAGESDKVRRARKKLQNKVEKDDKLITPDALKMAAKKMELRISNNKHRIQLKGKGFRLFDSNTKSAKTTSRHVEKLRRDIAMDSTKQTTRSSSLQGRIKKDYDPQ